MNPESRYLQELIIAELGVPAAFDAAVEIEQRVEFLADRLRVTGATGYVLAISGGVDSAVAGRLAQLAVERIRSEGGQAGFVAVRLPYGVQADEADAQRALAFIKPDETLDVNIKPATDAMVEARKVRRATRMLDLSRQPFLGDGDTAQLRRDGGRSSLSAAGTMLTVAPADSWAAASAASLRLSRERRS